MPIWKPIVVLLHTETYWHRNYRSKQTPADGEIIIETNDDDGRFTFLSGLQSGYNLSSGIIFCKIIIGFHGQILLKWSFQGRKIFVNHFFTVEALDDPKHKCSWPTTLLFSQKI